MPISAASRRQFLAALACTPLLSGAGTPPRIGLILADSWPRGRRVPDPGTPFVTFTRAYTTCPEPGPARQSILSGLFPHKEAEMKPVDWISVLSPDADWGAYQSPDSILVFTACRADPEDEPYERVVHVPLLIRYPRLLPKSETYDFPVSLADLVPTIAGLAGKEIDATDGQNLAPLLTAGKGQRPESVLVEGALKTRGEWRCLVRGLDKIVVNRNFEATYLYNLGEDPGEQDNLAENAGLELKRNELRAVLRVWMRRVEDRMDSSGLKRR